MERVAIIEFEIEGKAEPQGRPRATHTGIGKGIRLYDPPKSKAYKQVVGLKGRAHMARNHLEAHTEPLRVTLGFYFKPPKSYTKKRLKAIESKRELHVKKPDSDNLAKAVTDALNTICYKDDSQIVELIIRKEYSCKDYTSIKIEPIHVEGAN